MAFGSTLSAFWHDFVRLCAAIIKINFGSTLSAYWPTSTISSSLHLALIQSLPQTWELFEILAFAIQQKIEYLLENLSDQLHQMISFAFSLVEQKAYVLNFVLADRHCYWALQELSSWL
jgi:hypothetical protein